MRNNGVSITLTLTMAGMCAVVVAGWACVEGVKSVGKKFLDWCKSEEENK